MILITKLAQAKINFKCVRGSSCYPTELPTSARIEEKFVKYRKQTNFFPNHMKMKNPVPSTSYWILAAIKGKKLIYSPFLYFEVCK